MENSEKQNEFTRNVYGPYDAAVQTELDKHSSVLASLKSRRFVNYTQGFLLLCGSCALLAVVFVLSYKYFYANPYENVNQSVPYNNQHDQYSYEDFNINQKYNDPSNFNNIQYNENPQFGDSNYDNTNSGYYGMNNYDNQQRLKEQNTGQHISQGQGFNTMPDEFKPELNYNGNRFDNMQQLGCPTYEMDIDYVSYNNNESEADYDSQIQRNQQGLTNTSIDHNKNLNKNVSSNRMLQN